MKTTANFNYSSIRFDQDTKNQLVLTLTAPKMEGTQRPALCLIPLIDVSPSMSGEKITYAKRSLIKMIENLSGSDYCGLVSFASMARKESDPKKCTQSFKEELKRKVNALDIWGGTNIADALLEGLKMANNMDLSGEVITRVILFTDGMANTGPARTPTEMLALVEPNLGISTISAFGYGEDSQKEFLLDLAKKGNGNFAFVQNPDDALSAFGKELGGLLSTYATSLTIEVSPLANHSVEQVVSDVDAEEELGQVTITIPDLLSEEVRHIVLDTVLKTQSKVFPRSVNVMDIRVGYDILNGTMQKERIVTDIKAKIKFVKDGEQQSKPDPELDKIVGLAQLTRAQLIAEEQAKRGGYGAAAATMNTLSMDFGERGLELLKGVASNISSGMSTADNYVNTSSYRTSVLSGATRSVGASSYNASAASDLTSLGVTLSTDTQILYAQAFKQEDPQAPADLVNPDQIVPPSAPMDLQGIWSNPSQPLGQITWTTPHTVTSPVDVPTENILGGYTITAVDLIQGLYDAATAGTVPSTKEPEKTPKKRISQKTKRW